MYKFPMNFPMTTTATSGVDTVWTTRAESTDLPLTCAIPPDFNGPGGGFSPEDLYGLALSNCFVATFKVFAQFSKLSYQDLQIKSVLTVDRNDKGQPWMAQIALHIKISGVENKTLAERVFEKTKNGCLILNSVNTQKVFEVTYE